MESIEAETVVIEEDHYLKINTDPTIMIPISTDNANEVKSSFCAIIEQLRKGIFKIELKKANEDLFYFVAAEYVDQLNGEMQSIYDEMVHVGFLHDDAEGSEVDGEDVSFLQR